MPVYIGKSGDLVIVRSCVQWVLGFGILEEILGFRIWMEFPVFAFSNWWQSHFGRVGSCDQWILEFRDLEGGLGFGIWMKFPGGAFLNW